ncbi:E-beta-farnesene synthase [Tanacetum coccineum]
MSLQRFFKLHNWYQSHGALDLGSTSDKAPKPTSSQPPKPTPTPTKPSKEVQGKKCKLVKETSDAPSPAKRSKVGNMAKNRKSKSPLKLVDEFFDEGVPDKEPAYNDEEANFQRAMELSLKEQEERTQGPARPVVFREPDSGRFQPLPDVQGMGKEKVIEEQAAHDLLSLQTPKKKSPTDPFIFQRRTPMTTGPSGNAESPSLDAELDFADSETKSDEPDISVAKDTELEVTHTETLVMTFGIQDGGQGGSDLGKAEEVMKIVEVEQTTEEQIHEEFTSIMYLNVQDNLKLPVEEQSSDAEKEKTHAEAEVESMVTVTIQQDTSSVPPMTFKVVDPPRPRPDDPNVHSPLPSTILAATLTTTSITATTTPSVTTATPLLPPSQLPQSTIDTSIESLLDDAFIHIADLVQANLVLEEKLRKVESHDLSGLIEKQMQGYLQITSNLDGRIDNHESRLSALENLNLSHKVTVAVDEIVTDEVDWAMQAPLRARFSDLPAVDMKEILQQRMFKDNSYKAHDDHKNLFEALQKSLERDYSNQLLADLDEGRRKKRKKCDSPRTPSGSPPPPPPPAGASGVPVGLQVCPRLRPQHYIPWLRLHLTLDTSQVHLSDDEDTGNDHISKADMNVSDVENNWATALVLTYVPPTKNSLLAKTGDMTTFMNWYCQKVNKTVLTLADFEGQAYEVVKAFYPNVIHL